jgi:CheY-like chemotaxis protein
MAKRVLVVDDEALHRETLSALLQGGGIEVTACESAREALDVLRQPVHFDLALTDVLMPGMDGIEFARQARKLRPNLALVLVTGRDSAMDRVLSEGTVALLKPYSTETLNSVLREHLGVTI